MILRCDLCTVMKVTSIFDAPQAECTESAEVDSDHPAGLQFDTLPDILLAYVDASGMRPEFF